MLLAHCLSLYLLHYNMDRRRALHPMFALVYMHYALTLIVGEIRSLKGGNADVSLYADLLASASMSASSFLSSCCSPSDDDDEADAEGVTTPSICDRTMYQN